jgi:hypothetical protein
MKVGKNQNPSLFLATYQNLSLKSGDLEKKNLQNLVNLGHFSMKNPLYGLKSHFSSQNLAKFHPPLLALPAPKPLMWG